MGFFNKKKPLTGVVNPTLERDITGKFLSGTHEQKQNQRIASLETVVKMLLNESLKLKEQVQSGGCKCESKESVAKSRTKAKPTK